MDLFKGGGASVTGQQGGAFRGSSDDLPDPQCGSSTLVWGLQQGPQQGLEQGRLLVRDRGLLG